MHWFERLGALALFWGVPSKLFWCCGASSKAADGSEDIVLVVFCFRLGSPAEGVGSKMASRYYQEMQESFKNNSKSREFPAHSAKVHSVAWSCDGRRLASGSFDKTASVFVLEKDRLVSPANMLILQLAARHSEWMDACWDCELKSLKADLNFKKISLLAVSMTFI